MFFHWTDAYTVFKGLECSIGSDLKRAFKRIWIFNVPIVGLVFRILDLLVFLGLDTYSLSDTKLIKESNLYNGKITLIINYGIY